MSLDQRPGAARRMRRRPAADPEGEVRPEGACLRILAQYPRLIGAEWYRS
jgi:hypothetical protein